MPRVLCPRRRRPRLALRCSPTPRRGGVTWSPYHNVRPGTRYPPTLIVTGDHDARVMPAHSFKFAAALRAAQAGPGPILLRLELSSGHGGGPTTSQSIEQTADEYAFLLHALGVAGRWALPRERESPHGRPSGR
ncbi:MAG: S9 family peptidase [Deltaproteobacteria bacterium]|nr:S9 family peptidase [Deltaproteobacteria bacterium]